MAPTQPSFVSQPAIVRIPVLLRELLDGELLIPRFQRPSIWEPRQQLLLLDSIHRNYPIGSVLVWRTRTHELAFFDEIGGLKVKHGAHGAHGAPEYKQYVLDGHQRLATLLRMLGPGLVSAQTSLDDEGGLLLGEDDVEDVGDVFFDLGKEEFVRLPRKGKADPKWVPVSILLDPYKLDPFKVSLAKALGKDGRRLGQVADDLAVRFKDYTLPVTPLASEDLNFVTESFRRVNSAGTAMSEVHMVHALSWTGEHDLVSELELVQHRFTERGWEGLSSESLLTTCKAILNLDPARSHPDVLKHEIGKNSGALLLQVERCLAAATEFLSGMNVRGFKVLPYEYQLVVLAFVASAHGESLPFHLNDKLRTWFWYATYTGYLNNTVSLRKVLDSVREAQPKDGIPIPNDADLRVAPIRRVHFHNARTRAFALQLARVCPLGPDGASQESGVLLALHGGDALVSLLPKRLIKGRESAPENRVLVEPVRASDMRALCLDVPKFAIGGSKSKEKAKLDFYNTRMKILRSHLITEEAQLALGEQRYEDFLDLRRAEINRVEGEFVTTLGLEFGELG